MLFLEPLLFLNVESSYAQIHDTKIEMDRGPRFEAIVCPACGGIRRDFFSPPVQLILKKGILPDVLYFNNLYVSEKFRTAWEAEGLTGIEAFAPVETVRILGQKSLVSERYYMVVPAASEVQLDVLASGCISGSAVIRDMEAYRKDLYQRSIVCESCGRIHLRRHSGGIWTPAWKHPEKWIFRQDPVNDLCTIENAFNVGGPTFILSNRFITFVKKYRLTNVYGLTQEELYRIKPFEKHDSTPIYSDPELKILPPKPKKEWRKVSCANIQCNSGKFVVRDVLDDDEIFAMEIRAKAGKWHICLVPEGIPRAGSQYLVLRHEDSACVPFRKLGTIGLDSGALYLRTCGIDQRTEARIKDRLAEMEHAPELKSVEQLAISTRRSVNAIFLHAESGDGDCEIHVDDAEEASIIKIGPL